MKNLSLGFGLLISLSVLMTGCGDSNSGGTGGSAGTGGGAGAGGEGGGGGSACPSGQVPCDDVCIDEIAPTLGGDNGVQAAVFGQSCAFTNCHGTMGAQQAGLELSSVEVSQSELIDVDSTQMPSLVRVDPGDSSASYLMNKLLGEDLAPMTQQMPIGGMLCEARLQAVEQWIDDGAPIE
jgi:hypothetical protein